MSKPKFYYFPEQITIGEAKPRVMELAYNGGVSCPVCDRLVKVYRRKINSTMARALITLYREAGDDFIHHPSLSGDTHEMSELSWWGLVEELDERREDGGRKGWWRITQKGKLFAVRMKLVPKYAYVLDKQCLWLDGDLVSITDCLGYKFNYYELMNA